MYKSDSLYYYPTQSNLECPKVDKVILHTSVKTATTDVLTLFPTLVCMYLISGQYPKLTYAKRSVAGFKLRENQVLGCMVTLRNQRMMNFLDKLIHIVLPKVPDFKGLKSTSLSNNGCLNFGLSYVLAFPELEPHFEIFDKVRGIHVSVHTQSSNKEQALQALTRIGFPITN